MKEKAIAPIQDEELEEFAPIIRIGTETVLSQYPLHSLAKKSSVEIRVTKADAKGKLTTTWEVSPSRKYGEPGPLAYKIDTLLVNREIDESRPEVPEIIRLGSLREICEQLGLSPEGKNTQLVKKALHQNASAYITAKLDYVGADGTQRTFEFGASRYEVIFLGQRLPDGRKADGVYLILHRTFREFLGHAKVRPLDYKYLKSLPPAAQRLYELLSFQIFAALKYDNPRAKYLYSDLCRYAPLTRYNEWDKVKKQLYKIHQPHKESGYIKLVEFEATVDAEGRADWIMWYTPGRKARREYREFATKRMNASQKAALPLVSSPPRILIADAGEAALIADLMSAGITERKAGELVADHRQSVARELEAWPHRDRTRMKDAAAWLVRAIESGDYSQPQAVETKRRAKELSVKLKREEEETQRLRAEYRKVLEAGLETLKREYKEQYDAYATSFAREWDSTRHLVSTEDGKHEVELFHLEWFAGWQSDFPVPTFDEWQREKCIRN